MNYILKELSKKKENNQNGATAVEFAIVLLVFILITFGIIEFGLLVYNQHIVTNASREGARYGIVARDIDNRKTKVDIINQIDHWKKRIITFGNKNWTVEVESRNADGSKKSIDPEKCEQFEERLYVVVTYNYDFLFLPFNVPITSETIMICE